MRLKRGKKTESVPLVNAKNNVSEEPEQEQKLRKTFVTENIKIREYADENETINQDEYFWDEKIEKYYKVVSADCYGTLDFQELSQSSSSKFIRFSDSETTPANLYKLMVDHWNVKAPTLLISVTGGAKSFSISPRLKRDFLSGLQKVASTPGAWVISGGTDTGVMKMVGDASRGIENICIGVVTWGVLANKEMLTTNTAEGRNSDGTYSYEAESYLNLPTSLSYLDQHHTHFLLVDDGTVGNWGVEIKFRGDFEKHIMLEAKGQGKRVPTVLLVLEGGPGTLKTVHNAVQSKTPCVLVKGSGRATDMLVYAIDNADKIVGEGCCKKKYSGLVGEIQKLVGERAPHDTRTEEEVINELYGITIDCLEEKSIFTIIDQESGLDTDDAILTALLNDPNTSTSDYDKLRFTLHWNRVDLAEKVLSPMNQWKSRRQYEDKDKDEKKEKEKEEDEGKKELQRLLIMALIMNNVQFVELLIDYGVSLRSLLTRQVLEILYAHCSPSLLSTDQDGKCQKKSVEELEEEDKRFFLSLYWDNHQSSTQQITPTEVHRIDLSEIKENWLWNLLDDVPREYLASVMETHNGAEDLFDTPYRQLFIWSVLNNFLDMSIYLWQFVQDSMATALFASAIAYNMRKKLRAGFRNMQDTEEKEWTDSLDTYTRLSFDLLETCHKHNEMDTVVLVTKESDFFGGNCSTLDFAFTTNQKDFVAHRGIQEILDDEWSGSIKSKHSQCRIFATIFLPFLLISGMDIRKNIKNAQSNQHTSQDPTSNQLNFIKKLLYFHTESPNVRFLEHTIGYILFLVLFSYVAVAKRTMTFEWCEILLAITVFGYVFHEAYQMMHMDAPKLRTKISKYFFNFWNIFDLLCIILFFIALACRCITKSFAVGHLLYAMDVGLWIVRIIHILYADPISGPYVILIGKMSKDIMHFLIILVIFVLSYGVSVCAILEHETQGGNKLAAVYKPYFHLFGELFLEEQDDDNKTIFNTSKQNAYAEPIALIYLGFYILIANILLLNLLIAIFNSTYERVMATASRTWKFQRYQLIVEYAHQRTFICPPLNLVELAGRLVRYFSTQCTRQKKTTILSVRRTSGRRRPEEEEEALRYLERHSVSKVLRKRQENAMMEKEGDSGGASMAKSELEKKFLEQNDNYESLSEKTERNMTILKQIEKKFEEQEKKGDSGGATMAKSELENKCLEQNDNYESLSEKNEQNFALILKQIEKKFEEQEKKLKEQGEKQKESNSSLLEEMKKLLDKKQEVTL